MPFERVTISLTGCLAFSTTLAAASIASVLASPAIYPYFYPLKKNSYSIFINCLWYRLSFIMTNEFTDVLVFISQFYEDFNESFFCNSHKLCSFHKNTVDGVISKTATVHQVHILATSGEGCNTIVGGDRTCTFW